MMAESFEEANLQALLEKIAKDEGFKKPKYSIGNASKPGQNFVGRVFRVNITETEGQEKSVSLIFKASSTNQARQEAMGGDKLFKTESEMYEVVFPILNNLLKKHGIVDQPTFPGIPRCYATELNGAAEKGKADIIVLEDKKNERFVVVDTTTGLNGTQCRLALEKLALMHASSMALRELDPKTATHLKELLDKKYWLDNFVDVMADLRRGFITGLEMLEEPYKQGNSVYDNLHKLLDNFEQDFMARFRQTDSFYCITHLDCSSNNIMFKVNEDGSTEDVCLIDFQTACVANPMNDLATMLMVCTTKEERDKHFENLLKYYHDEVTKILRSFGCNPDEIFPWSLFQKYLHMYMKWGVVFALLGLPILLADKSDFCVDIHSSENAKVVFSDTVKVKNPETLKRVAKRLTEVVSDAARWGYI